MPLFTPRIRRRVVAAAALLIFVLLAGATYQGVATALERRDFRHPGGLISIGDHQLHIYCAGTGTPTVVLEAPAAAPSAAWGEVQHQVSATTRVCSYDRSGLGWSEAVDRPFDPGRVPEELRTLLTAATERGPFIVVGHGLGAAFARMYAARSDAEAVALIVVAAPEAGSPAGDQESWIMPVAPWLARAGVLRAGRLLSSEADALSNPWRGAVRAFLNRPDHLARSADELAKWDEAVRLADGAALPDGLSRADVEVGSRERVSFLSQSDSAAVIQAIETAVTNYRAAAP